MQNLNTTSFPQIVVIWNWIPTERFQIWCTISFSMEQQFKLENALGLMPGLHKGFRLHRWYLWTLEKLLYINNLLFKNLNVGTFRVNCRPIKYWATVLSQKTFLHAIITPCPLVNQVWCLCILSKRAILSPLKLIYCQFSRNIFLLTLLQGLWIW